MDNSLINIYKQNISEIEKKYNLLCGLHQKYKSTLKGYSNGDILNINVKSNTTVKDLKNDFEEFERWYSKFFNQLTYRLDKYYAVLKEYDDVDDAYNYKNAVTDCIYILLSLINNQELFISAVDIDSNLLDVEIYKEYLANLEKSFNSFI